MADISKITLPSGGTYDIKDAVARAAINGIFVIAWNGTSDPSTDEAKGKIPAGVTVKYSTNAARTGTLAASSETLGKFYLVKSSSQQNPTLLDIYDEYVTVDNGSTASPRYTWEKIGDTQIKLTEVVTGINYNPQTATVVGTGATLKINTYPTYKVTPATTYIKASSSGGAVTASGDNVTVMTGIGTPDKQDVLKSVSVTSKKLQTTGIYGVKSGDNSTTTASKATQATTQRTAKGTGTSSSDNTNWLKGVSVSNEVLTIGAATMDLQDTTQFTFSNVTVPIRADSSTTVANGNLVATSNTSNVGDTLVSVVEAKSTDKVAAITGIPSPTTDTVIGTSSTLSITTNPTITLATDTNSGTGRVQVAKGDEVTVSKTADGAIGFNSTDSKTVLTSATTITATHPS